MGVLCDSQLKILCEKKALVDPFDAALAEIQATLEACIAAMPHLAAMHASSPCPACRTACPACRQAGQAVRQAGQAVRCAADIDAELMLCVSVYHAAARIGGLSEQSLLLLFVRIAALAWVLHPELNEVGAQGFAWELIAAYADEQRSQRRRDEQNHQ